MRYIALILSCLALPVLPTSGQIFRLDERDFPTVRVWYVPRVPEQRQPPAIVHDNGMSVAIEEHTCMPTTSTPPAEILLCVDVSSSNAFWPQSRAIIDTIAATLVDQLNGEQYRFTVLTFNNEATAQTVNQRSLREVVGQVPFHGGTRYSAAFEEAARLFSPGDSHHRWIIFITDGLDTIEARQVRHLFGTTMPRVVILMLRNETPQCLRELARDSDGGWFELISAPDAAAVAAEQVARLISGQNWLCMIRYQALATCAVPHEVQLQFPTVTYGMRYTAPRTGKLDISTSHVYFGIPLIGTTRDATITITARGTPIRIDSTWMTGSPNFSAATVTRTTLLPNESATMTVLYRARDTNAAWGELHIRTSCGDEIVSLSVGRRFVPVKPSPFRIISPRGNERFFSGADVVLQWFGIPPDDTCRISISYDDGRSWQLVTDAASYFRYRWKVPPLDRAHTVRFRFERIGTHDIAISQPIIIEPPTGILRSTDLGQAQVGVRKDTVLRSFITNPSPAKPLIIERIEFEGDNPSDFGIAQGVFPLTIPPSSSIDLEVFFRPQQIGKRSAEILLISPSGYVRQLVWGHGIGTIPLHYIVDFGPVTIGQGRDEEIRLGRVVSGTRTWKGDSSVFTTQYLENAPSLKLVFRPDSVRRYRAQLLMHDTLGSAIIELYGEGVLPPPTVYISDPTRFRSLLAPTAEQLSRGTIGIGTFDGVGLLGVYAPTEPVAIFAGGLIPIRFGRQRSLAYGLGVRYAQSWSERVNIGAGVVAAQSASYTPDDTTTITLAVPFAVTTVQWGRLRLNAGIGYVFKEHRSTVERFRADVPIVALGGDILIAPQWKIAADLVHIGTVESLPLALTGRFFGERFSLDAGVIVGIPTGRGAHFVTLPLVSLFWMIR